MGGKKREKEKVDDGRQKGYLLLRGSGTHLFRVWRLQRTPMHKERGPAQKVEPFYMKIFPTLNGGSKRT